MFFIGELLRIAMHLHCPSAQRYKKGPDNATANTLRLTQSHQDVLFIANMFLLIVSALHLHRPSAQRYKNGPDNATANTLRLKQSHRDILFVANMFFDGELLRIALHLHTPSAQRYKKVPLMHPLTYYALNSPIGTSCL